jgi:hypothetical protein
MLKEELDPAQVDGTDTVRSGLFVLEKLEIPAHFIFIDQAWRFVVVTCKLA